MTTESEEEKAINVCEICLCKKKLCNRSNLSMLLHRTFEQGEQQGFKKGQEDERQTWLQATDLKDKFENTMKNVEFKARQEALEEVKEELDNIMEGWECNCEGNFSCQKHEILWRFEALKRGEKK